MQLKFNFHLRAALLCMLLALVPAAAFARTVRQPLPALSDPVDLYMRSVAVLSQQEERVADYEYWYSTISQRGCAPVSIANALFAAVGVTDRDQAAAILADLLPLITPEYKYKTEPIRFGLFAHALQPDAWYREREKLPALNALLSGYPGEIQASDETLEAVSLARRIDAGSARPLLLSGTAHMAGSPDQLAGMISMLHARGLDEATISLGHIAAGTDRTDGPLRTNGKGHYLSLFIHVGKFMQDGSVYILDSLPRAIEGEEHGGEYELRSLYHFVEASRCQTFRDTFSASRISPTVIRLSYTEAAQKTADAAKSAAYETPELKQQAIAAAHARLLSPLILYSSGVGIVVIP